MERYFTALSLRILFEEIHVSVVYEFEYLKEINMFGRLWFCDYFFDVFSFNHLYILFSFLFLNDASILTCTYI